MESVPGCAILTASPWPGKGYFPDSPPGGAGKRPAADFHERGLQKRDFRRRAGDFPHITGNKVTGKDFPELSGDRAPFFIRDFKVGRTGDPVKLMQVIGDNPEFKFLGEQPGKDSRIIVDAAQQNGLGKEGIMFPVEFLDLPVCVGRQFRRMVQVKDENQVLLIGTEPVEQVEEAGYTALYAYRRSQVLSVPEKEDQISEEELNSFEIVDRIDLDADYSSEWYNKPIILGEPTWTSPYYDPQINVLMITYSVPVYDRPDHIEAVMTADVSLEWLDQLIDTFDIGKSGEPVLITPDQIIYRSEVESEKGPSMCDINDAIACEKRLKHWTRAKKNALVESKNPNWDDWSEGFI